MKGREFIKSGNGDSARKAEHVAARAALIALLGRDDIQQAVVRYARSFSLPPRELWMDFFHPGEFVAAHGLYEKLKVMRQNLTPVGGIN